MQLITTIKHLLDACPVIQSIYVCVENSLITLHFFSSLRSDVLGNAFSCVLRVELDCLQKLLEVFSIPIDKPTGEKCVFFDFVFLCELYWIDTLEITRIPCIKFFDNKLF